MGSLEPQMTFRVGTYTGSKRAAFTLIELIVVILIVALMSGIVVPAYARFFARERFNSTVAAIQDIAAWASQRAVTLDETVTLAYDPSSRAFLAQAPPVSPSDAPQVMTQTSNPASASTLPDTRTYQLPRDMRVDGLHVQPISAASGSAPNTLHFYADGTCDPAQLAVVSADGYSETLIALPATSRLEDASTTGAGRS